MIFVNDEIVQAIGLEQTHMIYKEKTYEIVLKKMSRDWSELIVKQGISGIHTEDMVQLILIIGGKSYFLTVRIESIIYLQGYLFLEVGIVGGISEKIEKILDEYDKDPERKRKERRIVISEETLEVFRIQQRFTVLKDMTEYPSYVKNISNTAINFVAVKNIPGDVSEMMEFELHFDEPDEIILIRGTVLRKQVFESDGAELANLVVTLEQNERLKERIGQYFKVVHALVRPFLIGRM